MNILYHTDVLYTESKIKDLSDNDWLKEYWLSR